MNIKLTLLLLFIQISLGFSQSKKLVKISDVLITQEKAWNKGDLHGFMEHYWQNDSLTFISKKGIKKGWNSVYEGYKKSYADKGEMGTLSFKIFKIDLVGPKDALVLGSWKVVNASGTFEGYFTLWFKKINRHWLIVQDHTS